MSPREPDDFANHSRRSVLVELLAGYLLIFAIIGVLFGLATGIGVRTPWPVIAAIAVLWLVLTAAGLRRSAGKGAAGSPPDKTQSQGGKI